MNQRDSLAAGMRRVRQEAQSQIDASPGGEGAALSWAGPSAAPFQLGAYSALLEGHLARFYLGADDSGPNVCLLEPTPEGTSLLLPLGLRESPLIEWWEAQPYRVPYQHRQDVLRFCIGGEGTPGSGYLVRVYLDKRSGEIGIFLPADAAAAPFIRWYGEEEPS